MVDSRERVQSSEAAVLSAAERIFVRRGFEGARMQEIADEAGINKAMLHYYFRSKQKLFQAVFESILARSLPPLMDVLGSELPLGLKIRRFVDSYVDVLERTPGLPAFVLSELNRDPAHFEELIRVKAAPLVPALQRQIDDSVKSGRVRPVQAVELATTLMSLCVFPYVARPFMRAVCGLNDAAYSKFLATRKSAITDFVFSALQPPR